MTTIKRVSPVEAKRLVDEEGFTYVDVRTAAEFAAGRPAGARLVSWAHAGPAGMVPNPDFVATMEATFGKDAKLVLGCRTGVRSLKAAQALTDAGFTHVVDQRAGWDGARNAFGQVSEKGWAAEGLPTEKD